MKLVIEINEGLCERLYNHGINNLEREDKIAIAKAINSGKSLQKSYYIMNKYEDLICGNCGCSLFNEQTYIPQNYCPKCGAEITGTIEKEEY